MQSRLPKLRPSLRQKHLHLLRTPRSWLAIAGHNVHNIPLKSLHNLLFVVFSSLLEDRILGPTSDGNLIERLMHVSEACGLDLGAECIDGVDVAAGFGEGEGADVAPGTDDGIGGDGAVVSGPVNARLGLFDPAAGKKVVVGLLVEETPLLVGKGAVEIA